MSKYQTPSFSARLLAPQYWLLWLAVGLLWGFAQLPYRLQMAVGALIGRAIYALGSSRVKIVRANIRACFPDLAPAAQEQWVKQNLIDSGLGFVEQNMAWFMPLARVRALHDIDGLEHIPNQGTGAIVVVKHNTSVSLTTVGMATATLLAGMYRPHKNPVIDFLIFKSRTRARPGTEVIPRKNVRQMIKTLRQGRSVLYAPDQDYGLKQGVWATFFGLPAATVTATHGLAKSVGCPVVMANAYRKPDGSGYKVTLETLTDFPGPDATADTQRLNDLFEAQVREYPTQYLWAHRRFKNRPEGLASIYR